jgi:DNA-binding transcriptional regulator YiaG
MTTKTKPRKRTPAKRARVPSVGLSHIAGLRDLAHRRGEKLPGLVMHKPVDVAAVRAWEQKLRTPDPAAQTLLRVIEADPDAVRRAIRAA